jgi:cell division protein ZapB
MQLTEWITAHTISCMNKKVEQSPSAELASLEAQLQELLELCERLKGENHSLRDQQESLSGERAALIEKNELARARVEAMITRLKGMENSQ